MGYFLRGIPISRGIAIGRVVLRHDLMKNIRYTRIEAEKVMDEIEAYQKALETIRQETLVMREQAQQRLSDKNTSILDFHYNLIQEDFFQKDVIKRIESDYYNALSALHYELSLLKKRFEELESDYFQARFLDIKELANRIAHVLQGGVVERPTRENPAIIVAEEISSAEVLHLEKGAVQGLATESGSTTSHAAIIAESLEIPAVFGIKDLFNFIKKGDTIIVDGYKGIVIINPDEATVHSYEQLQRNYIAQEEANFHLINLPSRTTDDVGITLMANVSNSMELNIALRHGAEGIGLLRSEMIFMQNQRMMNENEQFDLYREFLILFSGKPVTIRTLDLGGDKFLNNPVHEANPFLGWRSIRIFLKEKDFFKQQLRAIMRSSVFNDNVKILIPMISSLSEVQQIKAILQECIAELKKEGRPFNYKIPLGIMVEIPSAAVMASTLIKEVDFFSIGTNDLVQYTLATDRGNPNVSEYYQPLNPAVLALIRLTIRAATAQRKPVSVCGEMARDPLYVRLLLGMGLRIFSVNPAYLPLVKSILLKSSAQQTKELWNTVKKLKTHEEIGEVLREDLKKHCPEIYDSYFYEEER
ncbi:phosphoenolpyruvate--protein phosphotransferase [Thermospira aquatica]|uniref:Phosphoenolpyruvate-protein phosphotransferase n=1 Tax=Thermospira aquatica TaxID=2828656 RepID=A0AAX3BF23_9SPIR|nr:phosphoenolpyruvate--protein phosphotransferase [Thermospira aquatica]URA10834.1 phosphoenolpyruvate--protein phosphotransferase [Thermospira aquatica]